MTASPSPVDSEPLARQEYGVPGTELAARAAQGDLQNTAEMRQLKEDFTRFMMQYKFGVDEVVTKLSILREDFNHVHDYNPIEHVSSRLKSPESIIDKVRRKGSDVSFDSIRKTITDIAGVRVTCSFISDTYRIFEMLTSQDDIRVLQVNDYIKNPKANGYKSLHAIIEIPVFLSGGQVPVVVEVQIRTIAMDFWASLEHKIYYKYDKQVPQQLLDGLKEAADTANRLDEKMQRLHAEVNGVKLAQSSEEFQEEAFQKLTPDDDILSWLETMRRSQS